MRERKIYKIKNKVFAINDIYKISKLIWQEKDKFERTDITFSLDCSDDTNYKSDSLEIFDAYGITSMKEWIALTLKKN